MSSWRGYALAAAAVIVASEVIALLGPLHLTNGSMVYLGAVLVVAVVAGRGPAVAAALGAFLALNFLFTEPRFTLAVNDPDVVVALLAFLLVAVVTSQLAAEQRERALQAAEREGEAVLLHDIATLLATRPLRRAAEGVAERLRADLGAVAVSIDLGGTRSRSIVAGNAGALREAISAGGSIDVLAPGTVADGGKPLRETSWRRIAAPHPPRRLPSGSRLLRVPIGSDEGSSTGRMHVLLQPSASRLPERMARVLATVANQLAAAAEQDALRRAATEAEMLRRSDELRRQLLNAVSHDLRTPLASIIAAAGSLRQTDVAWTDEDRRDFASAIEQEALRLNRIVGNLLDLGRIQDGSLVPSREWHDPSVVLQDAVDRLRASLPNREIQLDVPSDLPAVLLDAVEIDQVITNLVENAANASASTKPIRVSAGLVEGELRVSIEDQGPGLPPGPSSRLFEPFVRDPGEPASPGSGLGLAIARGLVAAHGGRIWAENRPRGGAKFEFALPAGPAPEMDPS